MVQCRSFSPLGKKLLLALPSLPSSSRSRSRFPSKAGCVSIQHTRRGGLCTSSRYQERNRPVPSEQSPALEKRSTKSILNHTSSQLLTDIAFAFDIDGVLYRGGEPVPGAKEVLQTLQREGLRYIFLTNGGGTHESAKVASLVKRLGLPNDDAVRNRMIVSHTPMKGWDGRLKKEGTVLITGSHPETAREVAIKYGFERVVTPADLLAANSKIYPFAHLRDSLHSKFRVLPDGKSAAAVTDPYNSSVPHDALKIDKILVWNDPRDWSLDIQVIYDLLISHQGYLGTISSRNGDTSLPNNGWQQDGQPDVWISNLDLFWKTEYSVNRFGTGAFVEALKGVWAATTDGIELQYNALGKPSKYTYDYAHDRLLHYEAHHGPGERITKRPVRRVYMIGDNPESDIKGANDFSPADGTEWLSILVRTGVWKASAGEPEPRHTPAVTVDDVVDAIVWAIRNEGGEIARESLLSDR